MENRGQPGDLAATWEVAATFLGWHRETERTLRDRCATTITQFWVLLIADDHGPASIRYTVDLLDLNYTTVAECVATLEGKGALEKQRSDDDRRVVNLSITPKGRELLLAWDVCLVDLAKATWSDFDDQSRLRAFRSFYRMEERLGKVRMLGDMVRGDTSFIIACAQTALDFSEISRNLLVTPSQAVMLMRLHEEGPARPKDLALAMAESASDVSKLLAQARKKGLATLEEGNTKREVVADLTEEGRAKAAALESAAETMFEKHFASEQFDRVELRRTTKRLMGKLRARMTSVSR